MEGPNARDQSACCAFHTFLILVEVQMLATYMRRMRNNSLEISIAGSSYCPQLQLIYRVWWGFGFKLVNEGWEKFEGPGQGD